MTDIVQKLRAYRPRYGWPEEYSTIVEPTMNHVAADEIERLRAENERLREALASSESWISRWAKHVGNCSGSDETCTCGRAAILFEARAALAEKEST